MQASIHSYGLIDISRSTLCNCVNCVFVEYEDFDICMLLLYWWSTMNLFRFPHHIPFSLILIRYWNRDKQNLQCRFARLNDYNYLLLFLSYLCILYWCLLSPSNLYNKLLIELFFTRFRFRSGELRYSLVVCLSLFLLIGFKFTISNVDLFFPDQIKVVVDFPT